MKTARVTGYSNEADSGRIKDLNSDNYLEFRKMDISDGTRADLLVGVTVRYEISSEGRPIISRISSIETPKQEWDVDAKIIMINENGLQVPLKPGFSWTIFFFGFFLGIPLFLRKLYWQGGVMAFLFVLYYAVFFSAGYIEFFGQRTYILFGMRVAEDDFFILLAAFFVMVIAIEVYFAVNGNKWYAQSLIENGYLPAHENKSQIVMLSEYLNIDYKRLQARADKRACEE